MLASFLDAIAPLRKIENHPRPAAKKIVYFLKQRLALLEMTMATGTQVTVSQGSRRYAGTLVRVGKHGSNTDGFTVELIIQPADNQPTETLTFPAYFLDVSSLTLVVRAHNDTNVTVSF